MKKLSIITFLILLPKLASGQYTYTWDTYGFSFTAPFEMTQIKRASADEFYWEAPGYMLEITAYTMGHYRFYYEERNMEFVVGKVAKERGFEDVFKKDTIPSIPESYYALGKSYAGNSNAYAAVVISTCINARKNCFLEAVIYCYENKYKKGIQITESFTFK